MTDPGDDAEVPSRPEGEVGGRRGVDDGRRSLRLVVLEDSGKAGR